MRTNTARVLPFEAAKREKFTAEELHIPKVSKNLTEALAQVKPLFNEWMLAEGTFEHNTIEVAKAVAKAWELFKASEPNGTKAGFSRFFDSTIAEDAKVRDLASNATYNRILYLLHKVAPGDAGKPAVTAEARLKQREKRIRGEWRRFSKGWQGREEVAEVRTLVANLLSLVLPTASVERALA